MGEACEWYSERYRGCQYWPDSWNRGRGTGGGTEQHALFEEVP